ncbi:MAG: hypothetical protein JST82_03445 [Bacteroidetes bacterium]|nr:hypothetical protein [Bacteroidota bacterium]
MTKIKHISVFALLSILLLAAPKASFAGCWPHKSWCNYCCYCGKQCNCGYSSTPLDGGLSLLLVAGAAYGGKRYARMRKDKKQNEQQEK